MREEYKVAYKNANRVLSMIQPSGEDMIRTASVINAVEEILKIDVRFSDYDFSKLGDGTFDFTQFGAAMCVADIDGKRTASILLNEKETDEMKRFSLVHELGHLLTQPELTDFESGFRVSTHIDMRITSIPEEVLDDPQNDFLVKEQAANIFALAVLIPYDILLDVLKHKTHEKAAKFFGVEVDALSSRKLLEDAQKNG